MPKPSQSTGTFLETSYTQFSALGPTFGPGWALKFLIIQLDRALGQASLNVELPGYCSALDELL